jgi:hypothetical protein
LPHLVHTETTGRFGENATSFNGMAQEGEDRARMTEHPPRTLLTWDQTCFYVRDEMAKYVSRLVTPLSLSDSPDRGSSCATGNYLTLRDVPYLLTNEHVVGEAVGYDLAHLPGPTDDYVLCNNAWLAAVITRRTGRRGDRQDG